jgi:hypothetical protein
MAALLLATAVVVFVVMQRDEARRRRRRLEAEYEHLRDLRMSRAESRERLNAIVKSLEGRP